MAKGGRPGGIVTGAQSKTAGKIARQTRNLKNEQYRIINADGEVVSVGKGDKHSVGTTIGEKRDKMPGAVSIHNHPNGGTFSEADFSDFGYGARAIYAAAPEGTYSLVNKNFGTKKAKATWVEMREAYGKAVGGEVSFMDLRRQAQSTKRYQKANARVKKLSDQWVKAREAKKSQSVLDGIARRANAAIDKAKRILGEETRKAEVGPAHNWLRSNAGKYGFAYHFEKVGR